MSLAIKRQGFPGAHITSYVPDGRSELLWMSSKAQFAPGQSIRGGIPLCWPWFGPHSEDGTQPQHGYARNSDFEVVSSTADDASTRLVLRLKSDHAVRVGLQMDVEIRLSEQLWLEIKTTNTGSSPAYVGSALHTYFHVSEVRQIQIPELQGLQYKDKLNKAQALQDQSQPLKVQSEVDRVYLSPPQTVHLVDSGFSRNLEIKTWGNRDLVVWNPWIENAQAMADFDDEAYQSMICIEPANALDNQIELALGESYSLGKSIKLLKDYSSVMTIN